MYWKKKENNRKGTKYSVLETLLRHIKYCILKDGATRALSFENPVCQLNNLARPFTEAKNWGKIHFQDFVIKKNLITSVHTSIHTVVIAL